MTDSRTRSLTLVAALATIGMVVSAASCTGPADKKAEKPSKASPAVAKGDKTSAMPGGGGTTAAGAPAAAPADGGATTSGKPATPPAAPAAPGGTAAKPATPATTTPVAPAATTARADGGPVAPPKPGAPLPAPVPPRGGRDSGATTPVPPAPTAEKPTTPPAPPAPTATGPTPPRPVPPAPTTTTPPVAPPPAPPAAPTATTPKPVEPKPAPVATAQSEADALLAQRIKELELERQKNAILVEDYVAHAREAAKRFDHESTADWASRALELDHSNQEAESLLRTARAAMGERDSDIASLAELLSRTASVKREQAQFQAQRYWTSAQEAKKGGDFAKAEQDLESCLTVIEHDPSGINWGAMPTSVRNELADVRKLRADADKAARASAARDAYKSVKEEEARRRLAEVEKRNALFEAAMTAFENEQYASAETLLQDYLALVPGDTNAQQLLATATRAKHERASEESLKLQRERFREWRLDMRETTVPYHKILNWPSQEHWDRITQLRADAGVLADREPDSPDTAATKNKLRSERVTFQFQGAEFAEVIRYIADTRQMSIVIDPQVAQELEAIPITLNLQGVAVEEALKTINRIAGGLTYVVKGGVVVITKPEFAREDPIVQVHSVGDLTVALTNFIAPNLQLRPAGAEENEDAPMFGAAQEGVTSFGDTDALMTLIQGNVADPDYWTADGVSIAPSGTDKLVVVAAPNVQREVSAFLDDLRAFSGLVVTIETRFLTVTDDFLRDVGIDIRGIGNGTPGRLALLDDVTNGLLNNASAGFDNGGVGLPANASSAPSAGAFYNNNSDGDYRARTENVFDQALGTRITNIGGAVLQYTLVDDTDLSLILRAVEKSQEGRVLQAPSVTVFNTQRANITLINQLTFVQDFDVEVAQTAFIADPIIGIIQDGVVLDVQPTVSHDRKYITLQLRPTIANLVRPIPTFTTSLGAFTTPVTIQIPELQVQKAGTTVRVPDGGTLLMGGLKNISQRDLKSETPWISSIPFASFFFSRKGSSEEMRNLMVIVKATISDLKEQEARLRR